mmetsp:Transcript_46618/g.109656  ORF Transcript_46618/g.109656 Transcript_46618/m.109656 type:complete len:86 (-) Transcript_46618:319-576(-)
MVRLLFGLLCIVVVVEASQLQHAINWLAFRTKGGKRDTPQCKKFIKEFLKNNTDWKGDMTKLEEECQFARNVVQQTKQQEAYTRV